jgi:hypothetical protein
MSKPTNEPQVVTFRPVEPLPPSNPRLWRKVPNPRGAKYLAYALGSRATVEEITGNKTEPGQRWQWQVIKFGASKPVIDVTRDLAMRAAEFALGIAEMEVEK